MRLKSESKEMIEWLKAKAWAITKNAWQIKK
jgi:hypothetical protein